MAPMIGDIWEAFITSDKAGKIMESKQYQIPQYNKFEAGKIAIS